MMPVGADVTVPFPLPFLVTVSVYVLSVKVAVTFLTAVIATVQVPVPVQPVTPDQPAKVEPVRAAAVRTTLSLAANKAEQVVPQLMSVPAVTVPVPVPALVTVRA